MIIGKVGSTGCEAYRFAVNESRQTGREQNGRKKNRQWLLTILGKLKLVQKAESLKKKNSVYTTLQSQKDSPDSKPTVFGTLE